MCPYQFHVAGYVGRTELLDVAQRSIAVVVLVTLDVGLVLQVDAILVAEVIHVWVVAVVRHTDVVDVAALHEENLVEHLLACDGMTTVQRRLVAVHALQLHGLVVDVEIASGLAEFILLGRCVAYLHLAEAKIGRDTVEQATLLVLQFSHQDMAVGFLCVPQASGYLHVETEGPCRFSRPCSDGLSGNLVSVEFHGIDFVGVVVSLLLLLALVLDVHFHPDPGRAAHLGGTHHQILDADLRGGGQVGAADDARQAEHVLGLQEGTVAVAIDLDGHHVLPFFIYIRCNVEGGRVAAVLGESHIVSVDPEVEEGIHTVEVQQHVATLPGCGQGEGAAVGTHLVGVLVGGVACVLGRTHHTLLPVAHLHLVVEHHGLVDIDGHAVLHLAVFAQSLYIPASGHLDVVPGRHVVGGLIELGRPVVGTCHPVELPGAVQRLVVTAPLAEHALGSLFVLEVEEVGRGLQLVEGEALGRLPLTSVRGCGTAVLETLQGGCHDGKVAVRPGCGGQAT